MLNAMVALVAGALIAYRGINILREMRKDSNHGFRLVWVGAVAGSVGLMIGPFFGYEFGWIELLIIASFGLQSALDRRAVCERTNAGARTRGYRKAL